MACYHNRNIRGIYHRTLGAASGAYITTSIILQNPDVQLDKAKMAYRNWSSFSTGGLCNRDWFKLTIEVMHKV
jgi:hypothetical protein